MTTGSTFGNLIAQGTPPARQRRERYTLPSTYHFEMCLMEVETFTKVSILEPNTRYSVLVWLVEDRQQGKVVKPPFTLQLVLEGNGAFQDSLPLDTMQNTIPDIEDVADFETAFTFETPAQLPTGQIDLTVKSHPVGSGYKASPVVTQPVQMRGNFHPVDETLLDACKITLDASQSERTAILYVLGNQEKIRLWGWSKVRPLPQTASIPLPKTSLGQFVDDHVLPEDIMQQMALFSRQNLPELVRWLKKLHHHYDDTLPLIITDEANSEIPWEMFFLPPNPFNGVDDTQSRATFLGERWPIVRWIPSVFDASTADYLWLDSVEEKTQGKIVGYYDPHNSDVLKEREKRLLNKHKGDHHYQLEKIRERLDAALDDVCMVYLGTHGFFAYDDMDQVAIGSQEDEKLRMTLLKFETLMAHRQRRFFFVNACHSGRLIWKEQKLLGLPEMFLSRFANGYIGTLGAVDATRAVEVAEFILEQCRDEVEGIRPAQALQQLRKAVAQKYTTHKLNKAYQKEFLFTFMYIYYGNPYLKIYPALKPPDGEADHE